VKVTQISLACLAIWMAAQLVAFAQDVAARVTASLTAITSADNNDARRDAIVAQLRALGVDPVLEPFGEGRTAGSNVLVTLPQTGGKTLVVGAHLDRVNVGRGAVDNAGSCVALIELVASLKAKPLPRTNVQIAFFDREENGLLGSRAFFGNGRRPDYALNLDVFAYGDTIFTTASHPDGVLMTSLRKAGEARGLSVRDVPRNRYPSSDHQTMMNAGIETLGLALVDAADVEGILQLGVGGLKPGQGPRVLTIIHTPNDTLDNVRIDQLTRGIALVEQLVRTIDSSD